MVCVTDGDESTLISKQPRSSWGPSASQYVDDTQYEEGEVLMSRSEQCPLWELRRNAVRPDAIVKSPSTPYVQLGVVTVVQDPSKRVLVTRRASTNPVFPGAWVMPGALVRPGERLYEAGARGLKEEVNLDVVTVGFGKMKLCGVWESVYPTCLADGNPEAHFLVFFYLAHCHDPSGLALCDELDACTWMDTEEVEYATGLKTDKARSLPRRVYGWETTTGHISTSAFPKELLEGTYPYENDQGLAEGHSWMLREWAEKKW